MMTLQHAETVTLAEAPQQAPEPEPKTYAEMTWDELVAERQRLMRQKAALMFENQAIDRQVAEVDAQAKRAMREIVAAGAPGH